MHGRHKSGTNKVVLDLHVWVKVLRKEVSICLLHNGPVGTSTLADGVGDHGNVGFIIQQDIHIIRADGIVLEAKEVVDGGTVIFHLLPSDKDLVSSRNLYGVREELTN